MAQDNRNRPQQSDQDRHHQSPGHGQNTGQRQGQGDPHRRTPGDQGSKQRPTGPTGQREESDVDDMDEVEEDRNGGYEDQDKRVP